MPQLTKRHLHSKAVWHYVLEAHKGHIYFDRRKPITEVCPKVLHLWGIFLGCSKGTQNGKTTIAGYSQVGDTVVKKSEQWSSKDLCHNNASQLTFSPRQTSSPKHISG